MKCLVTGSQGFVGKNLIPQLLKDGHDLLCITSKLKQVCKHPAIKYHVSELSAIDSSLFQDVDALIHLAAAGVDQNTMVDLHEAFQINVVDSYKVILNALTAGVRRIIYISSCFEYGLSALNNKSGLGVYDALLPQNQYAATKAALTTLLIPLCNYFPCSITILRTYNLYGDYERPTRLYPSIVKAIQDRQPLHITHGSQVKYFCHVSNLVEYISNNLRLPLQTYSLTLESLGGGSTKSVYTFAKELFEDSNIDPILFIKRTKKSRANEPQVLIPNLDSRLHVNGEP
jgi:nucleoside-diphosphate-sugar epimerase